MARTRSETDSMGSMDVPEDALYGAQTARAVENFPISGWPMPREFIAAVGLVKQAAAMVHREEGRLDEGKAQAIIEAAQEVINGDLDDQFVVDAFQTGSGTSTNMNANEVIANRAIQLLGGKVGDRSMVHPNDDVNMGQSSNDVIPTALHISAATGIHHQLVPHLRILQGTLETKSREFTDIVKLGRTHMMDAVPVRLGQEFAGYATQIDNNLGVIGTAVGWLCELPIGGSAVGTGLNVPEGFSEKVCKIIADRTGLPFRPAPNRFESQGAKDAALFASGTLRNTAVALGKIASDIRLLGSGPRGGIGELQLPAVQPGSSIMPGKVNPVLCESVIQVTCQVIGCDAAITAGASGGVGSILELNVAMPLIATNLLTAARLMANVTRLFDEKVLADLQARPERCSELVEKSSAIVTALAPVIGYDQAASIAHEAHETGRTIRQLCTEKQVLPADELARLLDLRSQTGT